MSDIVNYKSTRLLVEAVNREMELVRKAAMGNMALGPLNELRDLVALLIKKAERLAVEEVAELTPSDYVAAMKPLVAEYHRVLMTYDQLASCLCLDLRATACVVLVVGDGGVAVRTAHDPTRPEAAVVVETVLKALDDSFPKPTAGDAEEQLASTLGAAPLTPDQLEVGHIDASLSHRDCVDPDCQRCWPAGSNDPTPSR